VLCITADPNDDSSTNDNTAPTKEACIDILVILEEDPSNLSILVGGGKESDNGCLSNGERNGRLGVFEHKPKEL
jgi:hypothetical protein